MKFPAPIRIITALLGLSGLLLMGACQKEAEPQSWAPQEFVPPADGKVDAEKVRLFLLAHEALTRVSARYLESLEGASPETVRLIASALEIAREKVPHRYGLNGYAEYRWLMTEAPKNPANAALFEERGVELVDPATPKTP